MVGPETRLRKGADERGRFVVAHQGALGDFLLMLPALRGLHKIFPDAVMDFWSKPEHVAVIAAEPYTGEVHSCGGPELTPFFHESSWKDAPLPPFFLDSRAIIIFGQASGRALASRLSQRVDCPVHWICSFPPPGCTKPVFRFLSEQFRSIGWEVEDETEAFRPLEPAPDETAYVREWLRKEGLDGPCGPAVIHPGSGGRRKIWPLSRWWDLFHWLVKECGIPVVTVSGPADEELEEFLGKARSISGLRLLGGLSLPRLAALLAAARFYVGNDSGVSHLAAAMGTPTAAVFGPTSPEVWAPRGRRVKVVESGWEDADIFAWSPDKPPGLVEPAMREALTEIISKSGSIETDTGRR